MAISAGPMLQVPGTYWSTIWGNSFGWPGRLRSPEMLRRSHKAIRRTLPADAAGPGRAGRRRTASRCAPPPPTARARAGSRRRAGAAIPGPALPVAAPGPSSATAARRSTRRGRAGRPRRPGPARPAPGPGRAAPPAPRGRPARPARSNWPSPCPHRRCPVGAGVALEVLGVVDEQRRVRVEGPREAGEGGLLVERLQLLERRRPLQLAQLQPVGGARQGDLAGDAAHQHARPAVGAADAADREVGAVAEEVRALVAALQRRAVEVADRLLDQGLPPLVLDDQLAADHVDPADLVQADPAPALHLLDHQLLVVEALGAQQGDGEHHRVDPRGTPEPGAGLQRPDALDLAGRADHRDPRVGAEVELPQVEVAERHRLVVEAAGALAHLEIGRAHV